MGIKNALGRALLPIKQQSERSVHDLRILFLELTNRCNIDCLHCGSDCKRDTGQPDLPADAIVSVLEKIKAVHDSRQIMLIFSGGEPTLYPGVFNLGRRVVELGFPWGMVTNGFGWTKKTLKKAKDARLQSITVSLDGLEEDHNWLRGHPRSFERAVETIKGLAADPFYQKMDVISCVNRRNLDKLDEMRDLLVRLGVKSWRIFMISPIGRATEQPDLFLSPEEFRRLMDKIVEYRERDEIHVAYSESGYLGPCYENRVRSRPFFCMAGINVAGIMVNGDILACPNIDRRLKQGNIFEDDFVDVWENRYEPFRDRTWIKKGPCSNCKEWRLCHGNSLHTWDLDNDAPRVCHLNDFSLRESP